MRVTIPHELGREEVRRRFDAHAHEIADMLPGGLARIDTRWLDDDRLGLSIAALGQQMNGEVEIEDDRVTIALDLPPALALARPLIEGAVRSQGSKWLEPSGPAD